MKTALYRKYRPKTFDGIIGQDVIVTTLTNQIRKGAISHAYLFTGSRGTGKTSCAKIFSRAVNCLHPVNGSPCGECEVCKALEGDSNLDILEMDAASNNGVDKVREVIEGLGYTPTVGKYKVYIIDEVHMLSGSAFNALLKSLEEPPSHVVFILCTTEAHKIPATILSRCMRFDFKLVDTDKLAKLVGELYAKEGVVADEGAVKHIARLGEGSVRDTLSLADRCMSVGDNLTLDTVLSITGTGSRQQASELLKSIIDQDTVSVLRQIEQMTAAGKSAVQLASEITLFARDLILVKSGVTDGIDAGSETLAEMKALAERITTKRLTQIILAVGGVEMEIRYSTIPKVVLEGALIALTEGTEVINMADESLYATPVKGNSSSSVAKSVTPTKADSAANSANATNSNAAKDNKGKAAEPLHLNKASAEEVADFENALKKEQAENSINNAESLENVKGQSKAEIDFSKMTAKEILQKIPNTDESLGVLGYIRRNLRRNNELLLSGDYTALPDNCTRLIGKSFYIFADKEVYLTYADTESMKKVQKILDGLNGGYRLVVEQANTADTNVLKQLIEATQGLDTQIVNKYGKRLK